MSRKTNNKKNGSNDQQKLKTIRPLTDNQHKTFKEFDKDKNLLLHGYAGTGKTFLAVYLALRELQETDTGFFKIYIVRSAVPSRDLGFMPGSLDEKIEVYEAPYRAIVKELTERDNAYKEYKTHGVLEFLSTSFIRGTTFNNCIVIVDEIQNMDFGELSTIVTRIGTNCRIIFCGDFRQSDFRGWEENSKQDLHNFMRIIQSMPQQFSVIEFKVEDIVRSELVKQFIIQTYKIGDRVI